MILDLALLYSVFPQGFKLVCRLGGFCLMRVAAFRKRLKGNFWLSLSEMKLVLFNKDFTEKHLCLKASLGYVFLIQKFQT